MHLSLFLLAIPFKKPIFLTLNNMSKRTQVVDYGCYRHHLGVTFRQSTKHDCLLLCSIRTEKKLLKMDATIARAKSFAVDCNNVDKKLRQIVDLTEDEANFHMKQSAFLYQLAVQTMPKNLHCLSMRLTVEYFKHPLDMPPFPSEKYMNPVLHHYVILSNNILASSVVINSTVMHAEVSLFV